MKTRYVPEKPAKVSIRPEVHIAGLFSFKFVEGTHIRLQDQAFVFKSEWLQHYPSEAARTDQKGLKPDEIAREVTAINALVVQNRT